MVNINEVDRNKNLIQLICILLTEKRFIEIVMLGEVIIGDKHPSILKTFEVVTNMCDNVDVINIRKKIMSKLDELRLEY